MVQDTMGPRRYSRRRGPQRIRAATMGGVGAVVVGVLLAIHGGASSPPVRVTVHAGDTLWAIAAAHYGDQDIQSRVAQIEALNGLAGASLSPGRILTLPAP